MENTKGPLKEITDTQIQLKYGTLKSSNNNNNNNNNLNHNINPAEPKKHKVEHNTPFSMDDPLSKLLGRDEIHTHIMKEIAQLAPKAYILEAGFEQPFKDRRGIWHWWPSVHGEHDSYNHTYRVQLTFPPGYPKKRPVVRFGSIIHHYLIGNQLDDRAISQDYLENLLDLVAKHTQDELYSIDGALAVCRRIVSGKDFKTLGLEALEFAQEMANENKTRQEQIAEYKPLHPEIFDLQNGWKDEWFDPTFLKAIKTGNPAIVQDIMVPISKNVFQFPLFKPDFCDMFVEEVRSYEESRRGLPISRPNSMNRYGVIVNNIGLEKMFDSLQKNWLQPVLAYMFPKEGSFVDSHHTFIVKYSPDTDKGLDMHTDDSDLTINVSLNDQFVGAGLTFCGFRGNPDWQPERKFSFSYQHVKGKALIHLGRHRHGADHIMQGERCNLIMWNVCSAWRQTPEYLKAMQRDLEEEDPDLVCLSYTHDSDFESYRPYPPEHQPPKRA